MSQLVLVTGGAGFIGSHVVETLLASGYSVRILDNLSSGKLSNLSHLEGPFEFVEGDICDPKSIAGAMAGVAAVVHLAAEPSVAKSVEFPLETHQANYVGTLNVLEAMRVSDVKRIVYASSAATYTANNPEPHLETDMPDPSSPYGLDKLSGEFLLRAYGRLYGLHGTALRFFNIYGERQDPNSAYSGVISIFVNRLKAGQGITIFGDGYQSRDFVYVRDLAAFITSLVPKNEVPDLMNVGTGTSVTLRDLVEELEGILGIRAEVTFGEPRAGDIMVSRANVGRMRSLWDSPMTPLSIGLARLVSSLETR